MGFDASRPRRLGAVREGCVGTDSPSCWPSAVSTLFSQLSQRPHAHQPGVVAGVDDLAVFPSHSDISTASRNTYGRSEEHTSELQSLTNLVCRLLLEKNT